MRLAAIALFLALLLAPPANAEVWRDEQVNDLIEVAEAAPREGLPVPKDALEPVLALQHLNDVFPEAAIARDLAADALFARLADAYARGLVDPASVDHDWNIARPPIPDLGALMGNIQHGARPSIVLAGLLPASEEYGGLRSELARLRAAPTAPQASAHMTQILANMERWRWLPRSFPARRVEVRLAQYALRYFDGVTSAPMLYDVIVGAPRTPSPVFAATIGSVTLNPDWNPPMSIVNSELLPRFRRDPSRVTREGYQVLDANGSAVDPAVVDWQGRPFPYHLRQVPGAQNALGQLRFDLPNPFSVYLHDTPSQSLFERTTRALSHGCIRVKTPIALAASLLGDPWTESAINDAIAQGATQTIRLSQPTPVYLLYLTAVLGEDESVLYLDDINRRDAALAARLNGTNRQVVATASTAPATCAP